METYLLWASLALCLFSLWAILRHDWLRLTRPVRRSRGTVVGHSRGHDDGAATYSARIRFAAEDGEHEVIDPMLAPTPHLPLGTMVEVAWPAGRPDLARPPRPLLWALCYAVLLGLTTIVAARLAGWLGA
jgi:hypothetical protein